MLQLHKLLSPSTAQEDPGKKKDLWWGTQLEASLEVWNGAYQGEKDNWLRLFSSNGQPNPTEAEAALQRAEAAEAEVERLKAELTNIKKDKKKS